MREDGELTELKVEEEKVLIDADWNVETKVQYKGHVDSKGSVTGWGTYVEHSNRYWGDIVHTGTFLDGRKEGIFVEKYHRLGQDTEVVFICIKEYDKGCH